MQHWRNCSKLTNCFTRYRQGGYRGEILRREKIRRQQRCKRQSSSTARGCAPLAQIRLRRHISTASCFLKTPPAPFFNGVTKKTGARRVSLQQLETTFGLRLLCLLLPLSLALNAKASKKEGEREIRACVSVGEEREEKFRGTRGTRGIKDDRRAVTFALVTLSLSLKGGRDVALMKFTEQCSRFRGKP